MLSYLTNLFLPRFNTTKKLGDNRTATIGDINALIDVLKRSSPFAANTYTVLVTQSGGVLTPTLSVIGCSCVSGSGSCPTCLVTPCAYKCNNAISSLTQTGSGTYRLVVDATEYEPYNDIVVEVGNLSVAGWVTVEKVSATVFTIKTFNSAGVATSNLLSDTLMRINFFGKGSIGYLTQGDITK